MAGESTVSVIAKPQMRRLLHTQIKKNIFVAITLSLIGGAAFKFGVADVRKRRYAEFYRNYDAEKEFEVMRAKGLFQSC